MVGGLGVSEETGNEFQRFDGLVDTYSRVEKGETGTRQEQFVRGGLGLSVFSYQMPLQNPKILTFAPPNWAAIVTFLIKADK